MNVFDFHVHLGKSRDGASLNAAELRKQMRLSGVTRVVVFPIDEPDIGLSYEPQNKNILKIASRYKDLIPFCRLNPNNRNAALTELRSCYRLGFKGLKLHPRAEKIACNSVDFLLEEVSSYGWPGLIHTSHEENCRPLGWEKTFKKYGKTPFIFGHGGKDSFLEAVAVAKRCPNVYLETSTLSFNRTKSIVNLLGAKRVLFASDAPYSHMVLEKKKFELVCRKSELRYIFDLNARRLFPNGV